MRISYRDLYALEEHAGVDVIEQSYTTDGSVRYYQTTIGEFYTNKVFFSYLVGYLIGAASIAIKGGHKPPLTGRLVAVSKEAQRRDAAYYEQGRNRAVRELG